MRVKDSFDGIMLSSQSQKILIDICQVALLKDSTSDRIEGDDDNCFLGDPAVQKHQVWCGDHLHCEEDHAVQKVTTSLAVYRLCDGNDKEIRDNFQSVIAKPSI